MAQTKTLAHFAATDPASLFVAGGRLAIVICVLFGYPLQVHPCRGSVDKILTWFSSDDKSSFPEPPSTIKHFVMTTAILIGTYVIAMAVGQLDLVTFNLTDMAETIMCSFSYIFRCSHS